MERPFNKTGYYSLLSALKASALYGVIALMGLVLHVPAFNSTAQAQYLKPISLGTVLNPMDWDGLYDPGQVVSNALNQYGKGTEGLLWVTQENWLAKRGQKKKESIENPVEMEEGGEKNEKKPLPVQFVIEGELLLFNPRVAIPVSLTGVEPGGNYAEIQFHCRVIHYLTGRIAAERVLWAVGSGGTAPFPNSPESLLPGHADFQKTSMGQAIEQLAVRTLEFLRNELTRFPLEAQVLGWDEGLNQVTLNVGARNQVRVQDEFTIFRVILGVEDPITGVDLGDHYKKMGVVRVMEIGEGFAESTVLVGDQFKRGWVARLDSLSDQKLLAGKRDPGAEPNHDSGTGVFNINGREREYPRDTLTGVSVFDMFGFELNY